MVLVHKDVFALSSNVYCQQGRLKCVSNLFFQNSITANLSISEEKRDGANECV